MTNIVFAHGWGFDKNLWVDTIETFNISNYYLLDFGYTGTKTIPRIDESSPIIGIGHSLGFAWLLKNLKKPDCLVSISGFDCFYKIHPRQSIEKMRSNLKKNLAVQMKVFHKKAGSIFPTSPQYERQALTEGIENLLNWNLSKELESLTVPIFALASEDDKIVPPGHSKRMFHKFDFTVVKSGNHVIPKNNRPEYFRFINRVLNEIRL